MGSLSRHKTGTIVTENVQTPDGGYGWVVVACVFVISFLSFGTMYSIGMLFDVLMEEFQCSKSEVSLMASINFSLQCFLGPLVSLAHDRFGTRPVVFLGSLIISLSFICAAFAPNMHFLYFTFGVFGGIGMALTYLPVVVVISYYFEKQRSLATALGSIGCYAGCFVHPYLIRFLMSYYGWRGALLLLGGMALNSMAASMLLRPINKKRKELGRFDAKEREDDIRRLQLLVEDNTWDRQSSRLGSVSEEPEEDDEESLSRFDTLSEGRQRHQSLLGPLHVVTEERLIGDSRENLDNIDAEDTSSEKASFFVAKRQDSNSSFRKSRANPSRKMLATPRRQLSERTLNPSLTRQPFQLMKMPRNLSAPNFKHVDLKLAAPTTSLENKILSQTLVPITNSDGTTQRPRHIARISSFAHLYSHRVYHPALISTALSKTSTAGDSGAVTQCHDVGKEVSYSEILTNPEFIAFTCSNFLICLVFYLPSLFIVDWGRRIGISPEGTTLLLSLFGIGNIIGRPIVAFMSDKIANYRILLFSMLVATSGCATAATPSFQNFYFLAFFVFQFAFAIGGSQTMLTPILVDNVPLAKLGFAFGILIAGEGVAMLIGPALLGLLPTYSLTFTTAGLILISSALLISTATYVSRLFCQCHLVKAAENDP